MKSYTLEEASKMELLEFISQGLYGLKYRPEESTDNNVFLKIAYLPITFNSVNFNVKDRKMVCFMMRYLIYFSIQSILRMVLKQTCYQKIHQLMLSIS